MIHTKTLYYKASTPHITWRDFTIKTIFRLLFPPLLLWDGFKFLMNKLLGKRLGKQAVPAQDTFKIEYLNYQLHDNFFIKENANLYDFQRIKILTHDGAKLDTLEIKQKQGYKKYVIYFNTKATCYEHRLSESRELIHDLQMLGCNMVCFNYRGVSQSTGSVNAIADLVVDGIAQVDRLLALGVPAEEIILHGRSLGGTIALHVAAHYMKLGIQLHVFNIFGFSNVTNILMDRVAESSFLVRLMNWATIKLGLCATKFEINSTSAYLSLPPDKKDYLVLRSSKKERKKLSFPDDEIIPYSASLHVGLRPLRKKEKAALDAEIKDLVIINSSYVGILTKLEDLRKARERYRQRKVARINQDQNPLRHNLPLWTFKLKQGRGEESADKAFQHFVKGIEGSAMREVPLDVVVVGTNEPNVLHSLISRRIG
jgi:pimeloyl-ACP methyl ester carboxylesterase